MEVREALREFDGAQVTTLANHLEINWGTVHNHLSTLRDFGYVIKDWDEYGLGLKLFELGESVRRCNNLFAIPKFELDKLAEKSGELADLMIEESGYRIYLYIAKGGDALSLDTRTGDCQRLHITAAEKAILANLPRKRVERPSVLANSRRHAEHAHERGNALRGARDRPQSRERIRRGGTN